MDEYTIENIKKQHIDNYKKATLENIKNNTNVLVDEDIMSLLRKPPLDSMDLIKSRFLNLAKKNKIILNTDNLSLILDDYRNLIIKKCEDIKKLRIKELSKKIESFSFEKDNDTYKLMKKDFMDINKQIKKIIKDVLLESLENNIMVRIDSVFQENVDDLVKNKIITDVTKFIKGSYQKQLLENFDIKILVKDTTLMNGIKEQSERYLFTLNNSRLLNDNLDT